MWSRAASRANDWIEEWRVPSIIAGSAGIVARIEFSSVEIETCRSSVLKERNGNGIVTSRCVSSCESVHW
jgi:hypothetical protein